MRKTTIVLLALCAGSLSLAQSWRAPYEAGLGSLREAKWADARLRFQEAESRRPDTAGPTYLPGPITERRVWRDGSAYSPRFLAGYAAYKEGSASIGEAKATLLKAAASDFVYLLDAGKGSQSGYALLAQCYSLLGDSAAREQLAERYKAEGHRATFRVDLEAMSPEDAGQLAQLQAPAAPAQVTPSQPATVTAPTAGDPSGIAPVVVQAQGQPLAAAPMPVAPSGVPGLAAISGNPGKFALIIGNSLSAMPDRELPFAADDVMRVREALVSFAGYPEDNVVVATNATAAEIAAHVNALAERIQENSTVLIYFSGVGFNVGGKDYLAGIDTEFSTDAASMIAKSDVYRVLSAKGAVVFAFFQSARPVIDGRYFGSEIPVVGRIAQVQATIPGSMVHPVFKGGAQMGLFTDAFVSVLSRIKTDRVPILEFGWQVFNQIRRGDTGTTGGGSPQVPTLPVLTNLASDARF